MFDGDKVYYVYIHISIRNAKRVGIGWIIFATSPENGKFANLCECKYG